MALAGVKVVVLAALGPLHLDPSSVHHAQPPAKNQPACLDQRSRSQIRSIHLAIGPAGVFVIDSKQYRGRLQLDPAGRLWHGRYHLAPALRAVSLQADQAAQVLIDPTWWWCRLWLFMAPRCPGARWSSRACRWWRPGGCQACFASSRRCWGPSGSPSWPPRRGSASTPPLDRGMPGGALQVAAGAGCTRPPGPSPAPGGRSACRRRCPGTPSRRRTGRGTCAG
jgi:hypothetical protein